MLGTAANVRVNQLASLRDSVAEFPNVSNVDLCVVHRQTGGTSALAIMGVLAANGHAFC
jgi:hypothetical protein